MIDQSKIERELRRLSNEEKGKRIELIKIIMESDTKMLEMQKMTNEIKREERRARE